MLVPPIAQRLSFIYVFKFLHFIIEFSINGLRTAISLKMPISQRTPNTAQN